MMELLPFQKRTIDHILEFFKEHDVYLLADETGLGKTVIASEVARRLCLREDESYAPKNILYIASNLELANENVERKLKFEGSEVIKGRLSMLWSDMEKKNINENNPVKLFALTPEVSLLQNTSGQESERKKCLKKYYKLQETNTNIASEIGTVAIGLQEKIKKLSQAVSELENKIKNHEYEEVLYFKDGSSSFEFWYNYNVAIKNNMKLLSQEDTCVKKSFRDEEFDADDLNGSIKKAVKMMVEYHLQSLISERIKYGNIKEERHDILELDPIKKAIDELPNNQELIDINDYIDILWHDKPNSITDYRTTKYAAYILKNLDMDSIKKYIFDEDNKSKEIKKIEIKVYKFLKDIFNDECIRCIRTFMSLYSLKEYVNPDIVIIDEIQNYPEIFSKESLLEDERSQTVKAVIDTILDRDKNSESDEKHQKILMLSATPYAYRNAIEIEDDGDQGDETEDFVRHLVGMSDILDYLYEKNGKGENKNEDIVDEWKECQRSITEVAQKSVENGKVAENEFNAAKELIKDLQNHMIKLGISRTERPLKTFKPNDKSIDMELWEMADYYRNGRNSSWTRLALSLPERVEVDEYKGIGNATHVKAGFCEETITKRTKAFVNDLFADDNHLLLFMPPNNPTKELTGVFEGKERQYGKTVVFSAFNVVPGRLAGVIKKEQNKRILQKFEENYTKNLDKEKVEEKFNELLSKIEEVPYDEYLNAKTENTDSNTIRGYKDRDFSDADRKTLCEIFTSEYAKKVLLCIYGEKLVKDYWNFVDDYCISGNLEAVLEEFYYMRNTLRNSPTFSEYFNCGQEESSVDKSKKGDTLAIMNNAGFATVYSSKIPENLSEKLNCFNSPFYPFCFILTSVAEEGHDFHFYADRIVHWNAPSSPIALIQREGRIDRCDCMAVRKEIAGYAKENGEKFDTWGKLISWYKENKEIDGKYKDMFPRFISSDNETRIIRCCYYYKYSGEEFRWNVLMRNLEYYRSMFGACDQSVFVDKNKASIESNSEIWQKLKELSLDISIQDENVTIG